MEPFIGEIRVFSFGFVPRGWAACDGQMLQVRDHQALYSVIGNTYGGDGKINFAMPNLNGRTPIHPGNGIIRGQAGGEESHTLTVAEMPAHTHQVSGDSAPPKYFIPVDKVWATSPNKPFATVLNTTLHPSAISNTGGDQSHANMQPYLVVQYCIAVDGIFPPRP
ncbi:MAG: phage tail protein [Chloroflexi bacterium]|nr:phage tail protein [Chloroflexota bacterium]